MTAARGGRLRLALVLALLALGLAVPSGAGAQVSDADVHVAEAVLAIEDKQWDRALALLRQALEREPDHVEALYYTGVAHMGRGRPEEAVAVLQAARQKYPGEPSIAYQLGLAHVALEQYEAAAPLLEEVYARDPGLESLGYYVGFLRYRAGRYRAALEAFRAGRTGDPAIAELTRLYAGLSLQRLGLSAQAEAELAQIGQLRPASPLTAPAERLKSAISAAREVARRFRAEVRAGAFYDDNAGAEPDFRRGDPDVQALREGNRGTFGELFAVNLEYDWLRLEQWQGTVGFSFVGTHNNSLPEFDIQDYSGLLRLAHAFALADVTVLAAGSYTYDYLVLDNDELVQRHALAANLAVSATGRHVTVLLGRLEWKEYSESPPPVPAEEFQDALNSLVGLVHYVQFDRGRHLLKAGYQFDRDDTRGRNYDYYGHRFLAGAQYTLPWRDIRLTYDFDLHYRDYLHRHTLLPSARPGSRERSDHEYTQTARIEVPLPWFTRDQALFLTAEYVRRDVDSNLAAFDYDRNYGAIYFTWQY